MSLYKLLIFIVIVCAVSIARVFASTSLERAFGHVKEPPAYSFLTTALKLNTLEQLKRQIRKAKKLAVLSSWADSEKLYETAIHQFTDLESIDAVQEPFNLVECYLELSAIYIAQAKYEKSEELLRKLRAIAIDQNKSSIEIDLIDGNLCASNYLAAKANPATPYGEAKKKYDIHVVNFFLDIATERFFMSQRDESNLLGELANTIEQGVNGFHDASYWLSEARESFQRSDRVYSERCLWKAYFLCEKKLGMVHLETDVARNLLASFYAKNRNYDRAGLLIEDGIVCHSLEKDPERSADENQRTVLILMDCLDDLLNAKRGHPHSTRRRVFGQHPFIGVDGPL